MDNDVIDLTGPATGWEGPPRWRSNLAVGLVLAFILVCAAVTITYRYDHRDEWESGSAAWQRFDVSSDGRTLTFRTWGVGDCTRITGVDFSTDPTAGGALTATLETRRQTVRDGHPVFCTLGLAIDGSAYTLTFDRPVPDGTLISDGAMVPSASSCQRAQQVVRAPTHVASSSYGCMAAG